MSVASSQPEVIFDVNLEDFQTRVLDQSFERIVLVDFWAAWCAPCLVIAPILTEVVTEYNGQVLLAKLEVDEGENMKLAGQYQTRGFPTVILFRQGMEQARFISAQSKSFIQDFINPYLKQV